MNYEIEIWQYHIMVENYKSNNIEDILKWFKFNWMSCCDNGYTSFFVYKNSIELSFEELYNLGFY